VTPPARTEEEPVYRRVKGAILDRIRTGEWRPGQRIPSETELAEAFGCARMTVHRSLRELADAGVVERRRRAGTRVALQEGRNILFDIPRIDLQITRMGAAYRYEAVRREIVRPPPAVRAQLGLSPRRDALHVLCLHRADGAPFQLEDRWINLDTVPGARDADLATEPPGCWLLADVAWSDAEHVMSAANATEEEARLLDLPGGDALYVVERRTWSGGRVVTYARFSHPGRRYRLRTAIIPRPETEQAGR
jgi:GntR family histidine utilization transcriptional repressor